MMRRVLLGLAMVLALPTAGAAQDGLEPTHPRGNIGDWFPMDIYPPEAKRKGEQGRVVAQLSVDKTGAAVACKIVESSGSASLDARTCELALANARFVPAKDASGRPVASTYTLPAVRWELQDSPPTKLTGPWRVGAKIKIDSAGKIVSCSEQRTGPAPADVQMCAVTREMPPEFGTFARGNSTAPMTELVVESSLGIDGTPAIPMTYEADGREAIMMMIIHVDVNTDGKVSNCRVDAQSGPPITNTCTNPPGPFLPIDKPSGVRVKLVMSRPTAQ